MLAGAFVAHRSGMASNPRYDDEPQPWDDEPAARAHQHQRASAGHPTAGESSGAQPSSWGSTRGGQEHGGTSSHPEREPDQGRHPGITYWRWNGRNDDVGEILRFLDDLRNGKLRAIGTQELRIKVPEDERAIDQGGVMREFLTNVAEYLFKDKAKILRRDRDTHEVTVPSTESLCAHLTNTMTEHERAMLHSNMTVIGQFLAFVQNRNQEVSSHGKTFTLPISLPKAFFDALLYAGSTDAEYGACQVVSDLAKLERDLQATKDETFASVLHRLHRDFLYDVEENETVDRVGYFKYPYLEHVEGLHSRFRDESYVHAYAIGLLQALWSDEYPAFVALRHGYLTELVISRTPQATYDMLIGNVTYEAQEIIGKLTGFLPGKLIQAIRTLSAEERGNFVRFVTGSRALAQHQRMSVRTINMTDDLPRLASHTCFNALDISPDHTWPSSDAICERLRRAFLEMRSAAFGLA